MTPPPLSRQDLVEDLQNVYGANRQHMLVAFHGTGVEDTVEVHGQTVRVVPVRGELELRRRLLDVRDGDRVAFLVPWTVAVPIDLQARFAKNGRVFPVRRDRRLQTRFGAVEVDPSVHDSPLGPYVLAHHAQDTFPISGGRLTADAMWAAWLDRAWRLDSGGELALDVLLGWAATDARGPVFVETMTQRRAADVRAALLAHLERKLGPAGPAVWRAWEAGHGAAALETALVLGAIGTALGDRVVQMWLKTAAAPVFGGELSADAAAQLGSAADTALRYVERRSGKESPGAREQLRRIVLAADQRGNIDGLREFMIESPRLPSAWRARLDRLGAQLAAVAANPSADAAREAVAQLRALERHELFSQEEQTAVVRRAEMAVRLACWLVDRPDRERGPSMTELGDVELLAGWYVAEGGHLDWARRVARGREDDAFGRGVAAVLAAVDEARLALDRRFAAALPAWHEAGRPATQVVPIDQAVKRIAAKFLEEDPERKLLVILMDGMAWAQAVELLDSMGRRGSVWGPLAWHGMAGRRIGDAPFPPVMANFPTVTEVSRAAFFAGKSMPAGVVPKTSDDPKRWQTNRDALAFTPANDTPQLLLRGEGQTSDGSATQEALSRVADTSRRLVALVINTIDMSLKADVAQRHAWAVDSVKSLRDLLDRAAEVGRAVLLCSDHGHVPADRFQGAGALEDGARWRTWRSASEPVAPHEIGLRAGDGVWAPRGAHGVVLLTDDAHRYGGGAGAGEHGGATLAESIAPCVLIGNADVAARVDDRGQGVRPVRAPGWWHLDVGGGAPDRPEIVERRPSRKPKQTDKQLALIGVAPPPSPEPEPAAPAPRGRGTDSPLAGSKLLEARAPKPADRARVVQAVEFLRARNGVADAAAFAAELGVFAARAGGLVSQLQEILNVDGYQVLRYDRVAQQVHLDLAKLAQQFEIELPGGGAR